MREAVIRKLQPKLLVCGIGNKLRRDDGLGPHVVELLKDQTLPAHVTVLDYGTSGFKTALAIGEYKKVIFVDAVRSGKSPGQVYKSIIKVGEFSQDFPVSSFSLSLHESDLEHILLTAHSLGECPEEITLIGCEPEDLSLGIGLSVKAQHAVIEIIDLILRELSATAGVI